MLSIAPLLLLLAPLTAPSAQKAPALPPRARPALTPAAADFESAEKSFGGTLFSFGDPYLSVAPTGGPGIYQLTFNGTGTAWQEPFLLGVPTVPLSPAPLLVLFHAFGVSELDCLRNTSLMKRAMQRGWYVVAPRGAHDVNFGVPYAQENVRYVLDWLLESFDLDRARVYAAGFSMGGGTAASFAARHLSPEHPRIAALVNHTGTVSLSHAHLNESQAVRDILEHPMMYGGTPLEQPFAYGRSSVIDLGQGAVDPANDMARNLRHVPIQTWTATFDPVAYLLLQSDAVHAWMLALGGSALRVEVVSNEHAWRTLNAQQALDFLETKTLNVPGEGTHRLLADRDERFFDLGIEQDAPGAFTPVRWNLNRTLNRLVVDDTQNLWRLTAHTDALGLDTSVELVVVMGTQDGQPEVVRLTGYAAAPSAVLRNGQSTPDWSHDLALGTLTLYESDAAGYPNWRILP